VICGEGRAVIERDPRDVLEFVLDLRSYAKVDTKIRRIRSVERDGNRGTVRHGGHLRGLPGPPVTLRFELEPWSRLEFNSAGTGLSPWIFRFQGTFTCQPLTEGTEVVHRECFRFRAPWRSVLEPYARSWLEQDTRDEMARMKRLLEGAGEAVAP
jgi:hypothetical protein